MGIFQARTLEWVPTSYSRGSSQPRDRTWVSSLQTDFLLAEPPGMYTNSAWGVEVRQQKNLIVAIRHPAKYVVLTVSGRRWGRNPRGSILSVRTWPRWPGWGGKSCGLMPGLGASQLCPLAAPATTQEAILGGLGVPHLPTPAADWSNVRKKCRFWRSLQPRESWFPDTALSSAADPSMPPPSLSGGGVRVDLLCGSERARKLKHPLLQRKFGLAPLGR